MKKLILTIMAAVLLPCSVYASVSKKEVPLSGGVYIVTDNTTEWDGNMQLGSSCIEDKDGNKLTDEYLYIKPLAPSAGLYQFGVPAGHNSDWAGVLRVTDEGTKIIIPDGLTSYNAVDAGEASFFFPYQTNGEYYTPDGDKIDDLGEYLKPYEVSMARSSWADDAVKAGFDYGFMPSSIAYNFKNSITRAEFCRLCVQAVEERLRFYSDAELKDSYPSAYSDTDDWYVLAASDLGIVSGYPDGTFKPDNPISRQEAAVLLSNFCARFKDETQLNSVSASVFADDGSFGSWARASIYNITSLTCGSGDAVMVGTGKGRFSSNATYTREQAIVTMYRILYNII